MYSGSVFFQLIYFIIFFLFGKHDSQTNLTVISLNGIAPYVEPSRY